MHRLHPSTGLAPGLALALASALAFSGAALAQDPATVSDGGAARPGSGRDEDRRAAALASDTTSGSDSDSTGAAPVGAAPAVDFARVVHATVSGLPSPLEPGGSGEVRIVLAFHGNGLVERARGFVVRYEPQQGPLRFGSHSISPAQPARLAERFAQTPVWENTATIRVPVTIDARAAHGACRAAFLIEAEVTDGPSGSPLGLHRMVCAGDIEVGESAARTTRRTDAGSATAHTIAGGDTDADADADSDAADPDREKPRPARSRAAIQPASPEPTPAGDPLEAPAETQHAPLPFGLLAGSGAFLVLLLALLLRRRR